MRKLNVLVLVAIFVFVIGSMTYAADFFDNGSFTAKIGIDLNGDLTVAEDGVEYPGDIDVDNGMSISGEYLAPYSDNLELGVGVTYQTSRTMTFNGEHDFNYTPVYGVAKFESGIGKYSPYFLGHLGYNLFNIDDVEDVDVKGGLYYGIGAGMKVLDNLNAEVLYSVNNGSLDDGEDEMEVDYSKIRVGVSFAF